MHVRKLPVVLLLVGVAACGGGEPVSAPLPPEPVTAPQPAAEDEDVVGGGSPEYWSPSAVAALEAAKASYVPPPKKSAETATTAAAAPAKQTVTVAPTTPPAPAPAPAPTPTPIPTPTPTPTETFTPAPGEQDPNRPEATEPGAVWVEVVSCDADAREGWTRIDYRLFFEGTEGWTIHAEDNLREHDPVDSGLTELITKTDEDPEATVITDPEETRWSFRGDTATLPRRIAVPYHEDVLLRSPEGDVTPVPVIGLLVPRDRCTG